MEKYIPMFPLQIVVFPGETVRLHLFEERYKQLLEDCLRNQITFGIPTYYGGPLKEGTEVELEKVFKTYPDGAADISVKGLQSFELISFDNPMENKLYAGGEITSFKNIDDDNLVLKEQLVELAEEMLKMIGMKDQVIISENLKSFEIGHKIGLKLEEEVALLRLRRESERKKYIMDHLKKTIPVLRQMEDARTKIQANGHFRNFDPLDF
ncbi:MAG: LON peptidase substrate-binding domain-containing protein [Bacteroidota bacterium]